MQGVIAIDFFTFKNYFPWYDFVCIEICPAISLSKLKYDAYFPSIGYPGLLQHANPETRGLEMNLKLHIK